MPFQIFDQVSDITISSQMFKCTKNNNPITQVMYFLCNVITFILAKIIKNVFYCLNVT